VKVIKWQYKAREMRIPGDINDFNQRLNESGELGWELVGVFSTNYSEFDVIIFKRPVGLT
jgi:hypothetical protein